MGKKFEATRGHCMFLKMYPQGLFSSVKRPTNDASAQLRIKITCSHLQALKNISMYGSQNMSKTFKMIIESTFSGI